MALSIQPGRFGHSGKPDDAWLAKQEKEPILEPELPIIDTHHHLWDRGGWTYLLPELLADLNTGHNIVATVFEECRSMYRASGPVEMRPVGEVEFVAGIAAMSASDGYGAIKVAQSIVGFVDLALGDRVEPVIEELIRAGGGRLAGVRYSVGYDADPTIGNSRLDSAPQMYARPEVRAGVARLAARGLALDAWCYHPQLADVIALARAVPQATIVMCHVGGVLGYGAYAGKKDEVHAAWRANMAELATCPNVSVKLGGMLNRGAALNFRELSAPPNSEAWAAAWRPYVEPCIELFGAERCNLESNFPVDKMGTGYATLWNAFKRITAGCSPDREARPLQWYREAALSSRLRRGKIAVSRAKLARGSAVERGWVSEKDGWPLSAGRSLSPVHTQAWLAPSHDQLARSTGGYFQSSTPRAPNPVASDVGIQEKVPAERHRVSGVLLD